MIKSMCRIHVPKSNNPHFTDCLNKNKMMKANIGKAQSSKCPWHVSRKQDEDGKYYESAIQPI